MNYEEVYRQHAQDVYRFLLKLSGDAHLAEELTQECFFRAYKRIDSYDGSCKLTVWLCQIAKNLYFDWCRKKKPAPLPEQIPEQERLEDRLCDQSEAEKIHQLLHTLEEPYKEVFTLRVFGELSYRDIAALFCKSENWARVVFCRARAKIIDRLEPFGGS